MPERKVFEVHIEQGHKYGAKVVLRGEAGMSELGVLPGDVIFVLEAKPHKIFKRANNDLVMEKVRCCPEMVMNVHVPQASSGTSVSNGWYRSQSRLFLDLRQA